MLFVDCFKRMTELPETVLPEIETVLPEIETVLPEIETVLPETKRSPSNISLIIR